MKQILYQIEQAQSYNQVKKIINQNYPDVRKSRGTSRIVVPIGDQYVLKVAYNEKGVSQNLNEYRVYKDMPHYYKRFLAKVIKADETCGTWLIQQRVKPVRRLNSWITPREKRLAFIINNTQLRRYLVDQFDVIEGDLDQIGYLGKRVVLMDYGLTQSEYRRLYVKW